MAALDAGAREVTGVEGRQKLVDEACKTFADCNIDAGRYRFLTGDIFDRVREFEPGEFDLVLCLGFFYHTARHYELFAQLHRLRPRHIILDTEIIPGNGCLVGYRTEDVQLDRAAIATAEEQHEAIIGTPNHRMIVLLAKHFGYRWQMVDWTSLGLVDWADLGDYQADQRRTYVLELSE
jgi:hypothetical protein